MALAYKSLNSKYLILTLFISLLAVLSGCNAPKGHLEEFNRHFLCMDYETSATYAEKKISNKVDPKAEDLLWSLQLASVERIRKNYDKSTEYFDKAEEMLKFYDHKSTLGETIGSIAASDNVTPYRGEIYDGIMLNTYKGLNFMMTGDMELARVEFNRALDRQRRAKELFNKEIQKIQSELKEKERKSEFARKNVQNAEIRNLIASRYPSIDNFSVYPDFVNPFATYLAGLYFNLSGDCTKAVDLIKETYGMVPDNKYISQDLISTEQMLSNHQHVENTIWLIYENGLGPVRQEVRIDIPLFVATDKINYFGIAIPVLKNRNSAYNYLTAVSNNQSYQTQVVADMEQIIHTEFNKDFDAILARAIISATAKAIVQYSVNENNSSNSAWASLAVTLYNAMSTAADVRIWTTLPKDFQMARLPKPDNGILRINLPNSTGFEANIPQCNNAIVYVKIPTCQSTPVYEIITF